MPLELPPSDVSLDIDTPNIGLMNLSNLWGMIKIALLVVGIPSLVLVAILIYKLITRTEPTPQDDIVSDIKVSCSRNIRKGIKSVVIWNGDDYKITGDYEGDSKNKDGTITHILVAFPKGTGAGKLGALLSFLPAVVYDLIWDRRFIIIAPTKRVRKQEIFDKNCLVFTGDGIKYEGNTKMYTAEGHTGFDKKIMESFLGQVEKEYVHQFIKDVKTMQSNVLEVNPFVKAELLKRKEMEEGGDSGE